MLELFILLALLVAGALALTVLAIVGFFAKLALRLLLLPLLLIIGLVVGLVFLVLAGLGIVLAPVLVLAGLILAVPLLILAACLGLGWLVTAAA